jgi:AraC-like DNA-binding protein
MTARIKGMTPGDSGSRGMRDLTVAAGVPRTLVDLAVKKGASREALLRRARIDPAVLRDQDRRVPFESYVALMRAAKQACRDPALALHFGEAVDLSEMSIVGVLDHGDRTMEDAFAQINRYADLVVETGSAAPRIVIEQRAGEVWIVDTRPNPNDFPELTESTFARMVCGERRFFGANRLRAVHVTHPAPPYRAEYDRVFAAPVLFDSDRNALVYDASWWRQTVTGRSPYVSGVLAAHADRLLRELEQSRSMRGRVERVLLSNLQSRETSMAGVAAELGLTRQTLLRRLRAEGTTFARVRDELRRTVATDCLGLGLSVNETAYRVGFSDPAPFSRAFKRWTGRAPATFATRRVR